MNRAELSDALRAYLARPNMSDGDITTMIGIVEGELNRELRDHPRSKILAEWTIPTEDDQGEAYTEDTPILPLPVDLAGLQSVFDGYRIYHQLPQSSLQDPNACQQFSGTSGGYIERGNCLYLIPTPVRGTTMYIDYFAFLRPLAGGLDTNWVSTYFPDLYIYGMLKESAVYLKNDQRLAGWQAEFTRRLDGVQRQGWNQNIAAAPRMRNVR